MGCLESSCAKQCAAGIFAACYMNLTEMSTSVGDTLDNFETYTQGAEQDEEGSGDLPTYNDVAAHSSPNSRCAQTGKHIDHSNLTQRLMAALVAGEAG